MKIGIALGGGGARGLAHIGVLRVLESAHIPIDLIAGTSAGAIIGSFYAAGKSPDEIEALVRDLRLRHWLARDRTGMGLFSTDGFHRIIESAIGVGKRIEELPRRFFAVAVDLDSEEEKIFETGDVASAVCASAAFPGVLAPVQIGERYYIDGGALNPVPFDVLRHRGADVVLAVDLGADEPIFTAGNLRHRRDAWFFQLILTAEQQKIFRVVARVIGIMTRQVRLQKLKQAPPDMTIYPNVQNIGLMDFDLVEEAVAAGTNAAREALPEIVRVLYPPLPMRARRVWHKTIRQLKYLARS
jgi:NTE family protein